MSYSTPSGQNVHKAGAFDIRTFIALLIGIYGVVLVVIGLFFTGDPELARSDGVNINLWAGIGMVVVAALFQAWAMWRPVVVPEDPDDAAP
ncbi:MAG TPA: hypothetical protein VFG63_11730 [Nocardioidaceae bacterium]|nr:hypothetical protein [Nocardioidaceae bacterium]